MVIPVGAAVNANVSVSPASGSIASTSYRYGVPTSPTVMGVELMTGGRLSPFAVTTTVSGAQEEGETGRSQARVFGPTFGAGLSVPVGPILISADYAYMYNLLQDAQDKKIDHVHGGSLGIRYQF